MEFLDKVKALFVEREDQIRTATKKAGDFVDQKTKGKYHDKITKAGEKADQVIDKASDAARGPAAGSESGQQAGTTEASAAPGTEGPQSQQTGMPEQETTGGQDTTGEHEATPPTSG